MIRSVPILSLLVVLLTLAVSVPGYSQRIEAGDVEVGAFGGFSGGLPDLGPFILAGAQSVDPSATLSDSSDTHWNVGGNAGVGVAPNLLARGEVAYTRLFSGTLNTSGEDVGITLNLTEYTGGIDYLVPVGDSPAVPFVGAGLGVVRVTGGANVSGQSVSVSENDVSYNIGGGARIYLSDSFGLRPAIHLVHFPDETYWRATFGAFVGF